MQKWIDKNTTELLHVGDCGFYCVTAEGYGIPEKFFRAAVAIREFNQSMRELADVGDTLRKDQIDYINSTYAALLEQIDGGRADELDRKLRGANMELGRLRKQVKQLKEDLENE